MYIDIEPHLGVILGIQARFQVNFVISQDNAFPPLANLTNPKTVLPLFWLQEGYDELPESQLKKVKSLFFL